MFLFSNKRREKRARIFHDPTYHNLICWSIAKEECLRGEHPMSQEYTSRIVISNKKMNTSSKEEKSVTHRLRNWQRVV